MLRAGLKINVVPNTAEAQIDVRRLPDETREEVMARLRRIIHDSSVEISPAPGQEMPATEPSRPDTDLYRKMQAVIEESAMWHKQQGAEEALLGLIRQMW